MNWEAHVAENEKMWRDVEWDFQLLLPDAPHCLHKPCRLVDIAVNEVQSFDSISTNSPIVKELFVVASKIHCWKQDSRYCRYRVCVFDPSVNRQ